MRLKLLLSASCAAMLAAGAATPAAAQEASFERDRNVAVRERRIAGYDALGLRAGSFLLFPWVETGVVWSDNIFATPTDEQSDTVLTVSGAMRAQSQWARHELEAFVDFASAMYGDFDDESHTEWGVGADGRLDIVRGAWITGEAQRRYLVQPRSDASTPADAVEPVTYDFTSAAAAASREAGRVRLAADIGWSSYEYDPVQTLGLGLVSQSYRNEDIVYGGVRVDYAVSPAVSVYGVARGNDRDYEEEADPSDPSSVDRDSSGWDVGVGVDFDLTHTARGHVLVGYLQQDYADPAATIVDGFAMNMWIEWFPTQMTTVTASADRSINDTGVGEAAGTLTTQFGLQLDHELKRNIILWGRAGWALDDYDGIDREDTRVDLGLGADFKFNRLLAARVSVQRFDRSSSGGDPGFEYTEDRVGAALVVHP